MSTVEDLLLLLTDPVNGTTRLGAMQTDPVMGGAILFDLVAAGRLALEGRGRKARVVVADHAPVGDPLLDAAFARVRHRGRQTPRNAVSRLGKNAQRAAYEALTSRGRVRPRQVKVLGIFSLRRHDIVDTARRDGLLIRIQSCLVHEQPADSETGPLIGLLSAADLIKLVVDKPDRPRARARAKAIAEGDWASAAVRQAIQAAQAAVTAGIVASTAALSGGSS